MKNRRKNQIKKQNYTHTFKIFYHFFLLFGHMVYFVVVVCMFTCRVWKLSWNNRFATHENLYKCTANWARKQLSTTICSIIIKFAQTTFARYGIVSYILMAFRMGSAHSGQNYPYSRNCNSKHKRSLRTPFKSFALSMCTSSILHKNAQNLQMFSGPTCMMMKMEYLKSCFDGIFSIKLKQLIYCSPEHFGMREMDSWLLVNIACKLYRKCQNFGCD